jgi:hypothetical protein
MVPNRRALQLPFCVAGLGFSSFTSSRPAVRHRATRSIDHPLALWGYHSWEILASIPQRTAALILPITIWSAISRMVVEPELTTLEEHLLGCPACAERAEQSAVWVDAIRAAAAKPDLERLASRDGRRSYRPFSTEDLQLQLLLRRGDTLL